MKYYTELISTPLAEKLKEKGMPIEKEGEITWCPLYAEVFDWLMSEKNIYICLPPYWTTMKSGFEGYEAHITTFAPRHNTVLPEYSDTGLDWHEAANAAIEKALTLI